MVKVKTLTKRDRKYLESIFFKIDSGSSFSSPTAMMHEIERRGNPKNISLSQVKNFFAGQAGYILQKDSKERFFKPSYNVYFKGHMWQVDLTFLNKLGPYNDGYKIILGCIDSFTRLAYVRPLKQKDNKSVTNAMRSILNEVDYKVLHVLCDLGSEFRSQSFTQLMKDNSCKLYYSQTGSAHTIERFWRTLKHRISTYLIENRTQRYIDVLQDIVKSYNSTPTRALGGLRPIDVSRQNQYQLYLQMKNRRLKKSKKPFKYHVGDKVIISLKKNIFHNQLSTSWSLETFVIYRRYRIQNANLYKLTDCKGEHIIGTFYESEIQKVQNLINFYELGKLMKNEDSRKLITLKHHPKECQIWVSTEDYNKLLGKVQKL